MTIELSPFDAAEYIETNEDAAVFLNEALKTSNPGYIAHAVGVIARAKGNDRPCKKNRYCSRTAL